MTLENQVAIVTGSATGIGAACAVKLASLGARVIVNCTRSVADAEATVAAARQAGGDAMLVQGDISSDADCRHLAAAAVDRWQRIDILVNNAGTTKFADHADLGALTAEDFLSIYRVNVVGAYQMIRACALHLRDTGFGRVVNVSSIAGIQGVGSSVAYAASKGGLNTLTKSLARSLAPHIRVNAVCPGFVETRWFRDRYGDEQYEKIIEDKVNAVPLHRTAVPADVAEVVAFFAGEGARHITGETLLADGGQHIAIAGTVRRQPPRG